MSNLISGRTKKPQTTTLMRLCEILDTNQNYIMHGLGDPHAKPIPVEDAQIHRDLDKLPADKKQAIHAAIQAFLNTSK